MKRKLIFLVIVLFGSLSLYAQKKDNKLKIEQAIQVNHKRLENFYKKAMVDSLTDMYSSKCYYIRDFSERIDSQDDVKRKLNADFSAGFKVLDISFTPDDYKIYGEVVLEVGKLTLKFVDPKTKATLNQDYNYTMVWKGTKSGQYKIHSDMWGYTSNPCK